MKRNYQQMMDQTPCSVTMDVVYQDYKYYSPPQQPPPPPPQSVLFSNPFPSPTDYDGYIPSSECLSYFTNNRSLSEGFIHQPTESFGGTSSTPSSCNVSLGPATPPPSVIPFKYPITPSHLPQKPKPKRTSTACEECRKRKQKCDGEHPCQTCKEGKLDCRYREPSPTKKDNSMEKLVALIESCGKSMEALNKRLDVMTSTIQKMERRLSRCYQCGSTVELETGACQSCTHVASKL